MDPNQIPYLNALIMCPKFGPQRLAQLRRWWPQLSDIWQANLADLLKSKLPESLLQEFIALRSQINPEKAWQKVVDEGLELIALDDPRYPKRLKEIYSPPVGLYVRGDLTVANNATLAIVGSRRVSSYGQRVTEQLARQVAEAGLVVVSGLAYGVDTLALIAAVQAQRPAIAVLGNGLDQKSFYPRANWELGQKILARGGALVSEYPIGALPRPQNFPHRNRLISGLALGVLVVEAQDKSGSLWTTRHALEQNREVLAVPGSIFNPLSNGTNHLIKMGAHCIRNLDDILEAINLPSLPLPHIAPTSTLVNPASEHTNLICPHLSHEPIHIDLLVAKSGLPTAIVSTTLALLEIHGQVKNLGAMMYVKT